MRTVKSRRNKSLTAAQARLKRNHGTPEALEEAVWNAVGEISVAEAREAIASYRRDWRLAGLKK